MRLQERKGTVDGYEWRCRSQLKDNPLDVVQSVRKGTWFSESKLAFNYYLAYDEILVRQENECVRGECRSNGHKLVDDNFHEFLASIARVYPPTEHDEMQA
ncbi:hypothetical protein TNCV_1047061 [Trichonephila clavipes]|nr:hypothetical protein TNCV_1047061 [Trichonephila clavipes]